MCSCMNWMHSGTTCTLYIVYNHVLCTKLLDHQFPSTTSGGHVPYWPHVQLLLLCVILWPALKLKHQPWSCGVEGPCLVSSPSSFTTINQKRPGCYDNTLKFKLLHVYVYVCTIMWYRTFHCEPLCLWVAHVYTTTYHHWLQPPLHLRSSSLIPRLLHSGTRTLKLCRCGEPCIISHVRSGKGREGIGRT